MDGVDSRLHPGSHILLYMAFAVALPRLPGVGLMFILFLVLWANRARWGALRGLLRRTRWLFALLFLSYAWTLPGAPLWPLPETALSGPAVWLDILTPTHEGVMAGLQQAGRLFALLVLLDYSVLRLPRAELVTGLLAVLRPFKGLGLAPETLAVRLSLTIEAMVAPPRLRAVLQQLAQGEPPLLPAQPVRWRERRWTWRDGVTLSLAFGTLLALLALTGPAGVRHL